jgi:hypothetical protein
VPDAVETKEGKPMAGNIFNIVASCAAVISAITFVAVVVVGSIAEGEPRDWDDGSG